MPGIHTIQDFILDNDNMTPGLTTYDWVIEAAVHTGALYSDLVANLLNKDFTVEAFMETRTEPSS